MKQGYLGDARGQGEVRFQTLVSLEVKLKPKAFEQAINRLWKGKHVSVEESSHGEKYYVISYFGEADTREKIFKVIEEIENTVGLAIQARLALEMVDKDVLDSLISNVI